MRKFRNKNGMEQRATPSEIAETFITGRHNSIHGFNLTNP
jgi:hypothetical protein